MMNGKYISSYDLACFLYEKFDEQIEQTNGIEFEYVMTCIEECHQFWYDELNLDDLRNFIDVNTSFLTNTIKHHKDTYWMFRNPIIYFVYYLVQHYSIIELYRKGMDEFETYPNLLDIVYTDMTMFTETY